MADTKISVSGERDDDEGEGSSMLLKFSGVPQGGSGSVVSYLSDALSVVASLIPPEYPIASRRFRAKRLAVNLLSGITPSSGGSLVVQLYKNGVALSKALVTYEPGQTGVLTAKCKHASFERGDTLDCGVVATGFGAEVGEISVTIEGESTETRHRG